MGKIFIKKGHLRKCRKDEVTTGELKSRKTKKVYNPTKSVDQIAKEGPHFSDKEPHVARKPYFAQCLPLLHTVYSKFDFHFYYH